MNLIVSIKPLHDDGVLVGSCCCTSQGATGWTLNRHFYSECRLHWLHYQRCYNFHHYYHCNLRLSSGGGGIFCCEPTGDFKLHGLVLKLIETRATNKCIRPLLQSGAARLTLGWSVVVVVVLTLAATNTRLNGRKIFIVVVWHLLLLPLDICRPGDTHAPHK